MDNIDKNHFIEAIKFIYANIDKPLELKVIAKNLGTSASSLKRLFIKIANQSIGAFIRNLRMELAFRSLKNKEDSILEIALSVGFEDHSAFTRAFKAIFGYPPTLARRKLNIVSELNSISLEEPEILEVSEIAFQAVTEVGLYFEAAPKAWGKLKKLLSPTELGDDFSGTFIAIGHDNPHDGNVPENQVRFSAGITFLERNLNIEKSTIAQGNYARFHYQGKTNI